MGVRVRHRPSSALSTIRHPRSGRLWRRVGHHSPVRRRLPDAICQGYPAHRPAPYPRHSSGADRADDSAGCRHSPEPGADAESGRWCGKHPGPGARCHRDGDGQPPAQALDPSAIAQSAATAQPSAGDRRTDRTGSDGGAGPAAAADWRYGARPGAAGAALGAAAGSEPFAPCLPAIARLTGVASATAE